METEATETNGVSSYPLPTVETNEPEMSPLEAEIDAEIATIRASVLADTQPGEVALSFLHNARSLARDGKVELAERKRLAARRVLKGGKDE